jgi:aminotransferase
VDGIKELSVVTQNFTESVIRQMARHCRAVGGINLSQGFPDFEIPEALKEAAVAAINQGKNQYPVTFGEPALRQAISRKVRHYNRIECDPESEITVTCGSTEAMIAALKAIINPGDEIILFEPFYENYGPDSILSGAVPRYVTLNAPDWNYSSGELKNAFNNKTKAIILNTPHNPTGKVFSREELEEIAGLCEKWDVYAVTDEIYEHILFDGAKHVSPASLPGMKQRTITISAVSKTYAVTGWRVGWAIAGKAVTEAIRKVHDFLTVGAPTPLQHAAVTALSFDGQYYVDLRDYYQKARNFIFSLLQEAGFKPVLPRGAYYIMADITDLRDAWGLKDDFDFCRHLIETTGVATVPGSSFYSGPATGRNQVRFCFCKKWETLHAVEKALRKA